MKAVGFLLLLLGVVLLRAADGPAARLVILANARQPESLELARFYAAARGVPAANIIALPMPQEETITWRQFIDQVWQPLQDELYARGWIEGTATNLLDRLGRKRYAFINVRLSYLVTCRGVPLRIYNDPTLLENPAGRNIPTDFRRNESAVDAELSLIGHGSYEITAFVGNPLFNARPPASVESQMIVKVARLDGPSFASARHLVASALEAERTGLTGRYYVDLAARDPEGDRWFRSVERQLREMGMDGEVEETPDTFGTDTRLESPAFYFGWYAPGINGPFLRDDFAFPAGAIAMHLHSYSAQTLHSDQAGWCGPLVARGVAATMGNVFEPYLGLVHRPDLLVQALRQGLPLGDAAYFALPALSWQAVLIGDPLYRPWGKTPRPAVKPPNATNVAP